MTSAFTMAFQPIVDVDAGWRPFAYEALLRGPQGESASEVAAGVAADDAPAFDAACRRRALELAAFLGLRTRLSLNITAEAVENYCHGLHATLHAAREMKFPASRLIFEMTERTPIADVHRLARWIAAARNRGVTVALDDFGAGHANIGTVLRLRPHIVKLDKKLIRNIDTDRPRQALVRGVVSACAGLGSLVVAAGIETEAELRKLRDLGIGLMQGFHIARPAIATLPEVRLPPMAMPVPTARRKDARRGQERRSRHV